MHQCRSDTLKALLLALFCVNLHVANAYRYSVFVGGSTTWTAPSGATDISLTLWGGGGGGASTRYCGASGGSSATILNRTVNVAQWGIPIQNIQWTISVGQGGEGYSNIYENPNIGGEAGNGGETTVVAAAPNGTELYRATAYGGGGASAPTIDSRTACQGGAGGGASSSAIGPIPGAGNPPGAYDGNALAPPPQGALVGDIKAGGAGAGYGFADGNVDAPFTKGADWSIPGRFFPGGSNSTYAMTCYSWGGPMGNAWGGAAGYNGKGGAGQNSPVVDYTPANSGSGGGSSVICDGLKKYQDMAGGSGGVTIEYSHPLDPSATPTRTPTRTPSPTPSVTPSPSSQPLTQTGVWFISPINVKNLTPQDDGSVASLWYEPSYHSKWTVTRLSNGKYTFRSTYKNCYLTAHAASPDGYVRCESATAGTNGQWTILIGPENNWTFKSVHNTYMGTTFGGVIYLNQNSGLYWTKYSAA
jgi:hypothetical protein